MVQTYLFVIEIFRFRFEEFGIRGVQAGKTMCLEAKEGFRTLASESTKF